MKHWRITYLTGTTLCARLVTAFDIMMAVQTCGLPYDVVISIQQEPIPA